MKAEILNGLYEAIWFTNDDDLGETVWQEQVSAEAALKISNIVDEFITKAGDLIPQALDKEGYDIERVGNDLWFTMNGHGVGFWDRGFGDVGQELTNICDEIGELNVYVGDDGLIYCE